ncbi:MAG: peroxiredoxin family protein [Actinobacteria bacterium]|nr:peroxiredoxin family protein [Actinomycetota bacterium]
MPRALAICLTALGLVLSACGNGGEPAAPVAQRAPASPAAPQGAAGVPAPLDFTAAAIGGGEVEASAYAGRPVVLWFWSPW